MEEKDDDNVFGGNVIVDDDKLGKKWKWDDVVKEVRGVNIKCL